MKKYYYEGPTFKLWRGSWGSTFKFWRGFWGPIFKLWEGSQVPGTRVLKSWVLGSWSHFYTMLSLDSPNLYINWANMWYPDYQNKKLSLCILNSFKSFHLCIKWVIIWYPDNQLRTKLNLCMLLQANKNILCKNQIRIQNMY